ncbi:hypothetical protein [Embleya sp. NPDC005575]|uniref:hypothetical protein n=1 Tax=Embleya sp. NPDC005575 TaxID=3156892 RepID=UPI0033BDBF24
MPATTVVMSSLDQCPTSQGRPEACPTHRNGDPAFAMVIGADTDASGRIRKSMAYSQAW